MSSLEDICITFPRINAASDKVTTIKRTKPLRFYRRMHCTNCIRWVLSSINTYDQFITYNIWIEAGRVWERKYSSIESMTMMRMIVRMVVVDCAVGRHRLHACEKTIIYTGILFALRNIRFASLVLFQLSVWSPSIWWEFWFGSGCSAKLKR